MMRRVETIRVGLGYPAIMNDDVIIPKHLIRGATLAEARDYCTNCVETDIPGRTDSRAHSEYVNFPKCFWPWGTGWTRSRGSGWVPPRGPSGTCGPSGT